jgi:hypothetical protein
MPLYLFKNPNKDEYVEVHQGMKDDHSFVDDNGAEWERVWTAPQASMGMNSSPDSESQFIDKTKGWSLGDSWDYSKELGEKRKDKRGHDNVGETYENKRQAAIDAKKPSNKKTKKG